VQFLPPIAWTSKTFTCECARIGGVKVVISTDSHTTGNLSFIQYGVTTARRGWLSKADVLNTLGPEEFRQGATPENLAQPRVKQRGRSK